MNNRRSFDRGVGAPALVLGPVAPVDHRPDLVIEQVVELGILRAHGDQTLIAHRHRDLGALHRNV